MEGRGAAEGNKSVTLWPLRPKLPAREVRKPRWVLCTLLLVRLFFVGGPLQNFSSAAVFLRNKNQHTNMEGYEA